ncbi:hypothetical protein DH2020_024687 [Rehmannia glutinosa]|uniref:Reverse transcriptase Ty1/copia-type domain-containing protein n=1 Tax=Rehmannia glutinosa TaxID=99300 RepID=A0ABR0W4R6_REHGL
MLDELAALDRNPTWILVPREPDYNVVGCKWVFRVKRNSNGSVSRYKARLVVKGFKQRPDIDFHETFSPVVKTSTICIVLTIAISNGWMINQLDVNNTFLHSFLSEDVFMAQPPGFIDPARPNHVCKLVKSLYGLKQAPRAWFNELKNFILSLGFMNSRSDASLFVYSSKDTIAYILVYVDDLLITGNSNQFVEYIIRALSNNVFVKDLGAISYFLGIEAIHCHNGLFLSQHKYVRDLLDKFDTAGAKEATTPLSTFVSLSYSSSQPLQESKLYRSLIGGLQYLSLTRPDIGNHKKISSEML